MTPDPSICVSLRRHNLIPSRVFSSCAAACHISHERRIRKISRVIREIEALCLRTRRPGFTFANDRNIFSINRPQGKRYLAKKEKLSSKFSPNVRY